VRKYFRAEISVLRSHVSIKDVRPKSDFLDPPPSRTLSVEDTPVHGRPNRIVRKRPKHKIFCDPDPCGREGDVGLRCKLQNAIFLRFRFVDVCSRPPTIHIGSPPTLLSERLWWMVPYHTNSWIILQQPLCTMTLRQVFPADSVSKMILPQKATPIAINLILNILGQTMDHYWNTFKIGEIHNSNICLLWLILILKLQDIHKP